MDAAGEETASWPLRRAFLLAAEVALLAVAYFVLAKLSLRFATINPSATPVWPPTGFALAVLLLRGRRVWPAILVGAFAANATTAGSLATSAAIGVGNTLEALTGAGLLIAWAGGTRAFATQAGIARFALVAALACVVSASIGVGALAIGGFAEPARAGAIWTTWMLGDFAGAVVVAPLIVLWVERPTVDRRQRAETALMLLLAAAVGAVAFSPLRPRVDAGPALAFLAVAPLMWSAVRRGPRETAAVAFVLSAFAVWGVRAHAGPFVQPTLNQSFLLLVSFILAAALPSLALGAAFDEGRRALADGEADLQDARLKLLEAQKLEAVGRLAGGAAHDFNNLLTIILGQADRLAAKVDGDARRQVDAIAQAARRGATLTRQLLAFARRQPLAPEPVRLPDCFAAVRAMLADTLGEGFRLEIAAAEAAWPVQADAAELELALINLIVNARDAAGGQGRVRIAARNLSPGQAAEAAGLRGAVVAIAVADDGPGMSEDVLARAFEPFFTTKAEGRGTGLGLSQVHGFAHQSGGTVTAESRPGEGATVVLYLPRAEPPPPRRSLPGPAGRRLRAGRAVTTRP